MKKNQPGFNSLSYFQAHEKEVHWTQTLSHFKTSEKKTQPGLNSLSFFRAHEKEVHSDPNSLSHFKAHEKRSTGPNSHSHFKDREKEVRPDLFFNLRLRKASKPLRERV